MKIKTAFGISLLAFFLLILTFSVASANPFSTHPTDDPAPEGVCTLPPDTPPNPPKLQTPGDGTTTSSRSVLFTWRNNNCAVSYRISIWQNNVTLIKRTKIQNAHQYSITLNYNTWYYWNVRAYNAAGLFSTSAVIKFKTPAAPPPPPPPPTPTPGNGGGGGGGGGVGTPVPGTPPGNINNYSQHGKGVYLSDTPTGLAFADCGGGWHGYRQTANMYFVVLWFYPNEHVTFRRFDFNRAIYVGAPQTFTANGSGYLSVKFDTTQWLPDHQHLEFTGQSSKVFYCGHFDLNSNTNGPMSQEHEAHTPEELQRISDILKASIGPSIAPLTLP